MELEEMPNKYVAVVYKDNWYPGCVETLMNEN